LESRIDPIDTVSPPFCFAASVFRGLLRASLKLNILFLVVIGGR
jgi:hypothetical protein